MKVDVGFRVVVAPDWRATHLALTKTGTGAAARLRREVATDEHTFDLVVEERELRLDEDMHPSVNSMMVQREPACRFCASAFSLRVCARVAVPLTSCGHTDGDARKA